jgi:hypothetical protein
MSNSRSLKVHNLCLLCLIIVQPCLSLPEPGMHISLMWASPVLEVIATPQMLRSAYKAQDRFAIDTSSIPSMSVWINTLAGAALELFDAFCLHRVQSADASRLVNDGASPQHANEVCLQA